MNRCVKSATDSFQSTRPRGARQGKFPHWCVRSQSFNPRAREGRDRLKELARQIAEVSIHAPARGATWAEAVDAYRRGGFNPRAREGRDGRQTPTVKGFSSFNPRAREGRDNTLPAWNALTLRFNPRAREGRDTVM